jgi:hypothetical protein
MKKSLILFALAALLTSCGSSGIALTKDNASTYFALGSSGWTDCIMGKLDSTTGQYNAYFDIYPTKYMPNNNVKGACTFTFTPEDTSGTTYETVSLTASFVFHDGGTGEDGMAQMDSLRASFVYKTTVDNLTGTSTAKDLVFTSISGSVQG